MDRSPSPQGEPPAPRGVGRLAAVPDAVWAPLASALLVGVAAVAGLLVGRPWLFPSIGPTAVLAAEMPDNPVSRAWNTIAGHLGGIAAGFVALLLLGAAGDPGVLTDHVLTPGRATASVLAIGLTVLVGILARASHPPAAATTLLVTLGGIRTLEDVLALMGGVLLVTAVGEVVRALRLAPKPVPPERAAEPEASIRRFLRRRAV